MKKLTKKNLQQLAETVTILTELEQKKCIGSAFYYSPDGNLLGNLGNSYEIRIIDSDIFASLQYGNDDNCLFANSTPLYYASRTTQTHVINEMAYALGLTGVFVNTIYDQYGNIAYDTGAETYRLKNPENYSNYPESWIVINDATNIFKNGNFYDIMCTLIHEKEHYTGLDSNPDAEEYYAYRAQIHNEFFQHTSPEFKKSSYSMFAYYSSLYNR